MQWCWKYLDPLRVVMVRGKAMRYLRISYQCCPLRLELTAIRGLTGQIGAKT